VTEEQPDNPEEGVKETEAPKLVTLSEDQFNQLMSQMTSLAQQVDFLKNQVEANTTSQSQTTIPDTDKEEAVMHTLSRIKNAKEVQSVYSKSKANELVELAIDYALADFMKNPPKNRGEE